MKINRQLLEQKLAEAEDSVAVITPNDSEKEAIDKIEAEAKAEDTKVNPEEVVDAADKIDAKAAVVDLDTDTSLGVENKITRVLDACLEAAQRFKAEGSKEVANILICGLPGSGKTASVYD